MILAEILTFKTIFPFAVFGLFAAAAWWLLEQFAGKTPNAELRLDVLREPRRRRAAEAPKESGGAVSRMMEKAQPLAKPFQPKKEKDVNKLKSELVAGGFRNESAPTIYLGVRCALMIVGVVLCGGASLMTTGISQDTAVRTLIGAGVMFYLPTAVLWFITKRRKDQIFFGLPDALDLLVVCVEAGLGLDQAMRKVAEEIKKTFPVLSEEFGLCNFQLQMGRARSEVLKELGARTKVDDLRSLAAILIQADKFGSSIATALRVQSDAMRIRRRQLAEEKAAKTAVKLIFPLVLFIFPGIFVVLIGPAAIQVVREMLPRMGGG